MSIRPWSYMPLGKRRSVPSLPLCSFLSLYTGRRAFVPIYSENFTKPRPYFPMICPPWSWRDRGKRTIGVDPVHDLQLSSVQAYHQPGGTRSVCILHLPHQALTFPVKWRTAAEAERRPEVDATTADRTCPARTGAAEFVSLHLSPGEAKKRSFPCPGISR